MGGGRRLVRRARCLMGGSRVLGGRCVIVLAVVFGGRAVGLGGLLVVVSGFGMCLLGHVWLFLVALERRKPGWPAEIAPAEPVLPRSLA